MMKNYLGLLFNASVNTGKQNQALIKAHFKDDKMLNDEVAKITQVSGKQFDVIKKRRVKLNIFSNSASETLIASIEEIDKNSDFTPKEKQEKIAGAIRNYMKSEQNQELRFCVFLFDQITFLQNCALNSQSEEKKTELKETKEIKETPALKLGG